MSSAGQSLALKTPMFWGQSLYEPFSKDLDLMILPTQNILCFQSDIYAQKKGVESGNQKTTRSHKDHIFKCFYILYHASNKGKKNTGDQELHLKISP